MRFGSRAGSPESLEVPIETEPLELLSHRGRDEIVDRLAVGDPPADLRRADRRRFDRRRTRSAPETRTSTRGRIRAGRQRRDGRSTARPQALSTWTGRRAGRSRSRAPDRRSRRSRSRSTVRGWSSSSTSCSGNASFARARRVVWSSDDRPVARVGDDEDEHLVEREVPLGSGEQCDMAVVRRVESAAEDSRRHWYSSTSPSTSTSAPTRTPAARNASSSSSRLGGVPATR